MAKKTVEELLESVKSITTEENMEVATTLLEDIADSVVSNGEIERLTQELKEQKQRYFDRFFSKPESKEGDRELTYETVEETKETEEAVEIYEDLEELAEKEW